MAAKVKPVLLETQLQQDKDMDYWNVSIHEIASACDELGVRLDRVPVSQKSRRGVHADCELYACHALLSR